MEIFFVSSFHVHVFGVQTISLEVVTVMFVRNPNECQLAKD